MRKIDELAVREHGLTVSGLMEKAGFAVVKAMEEALGSLKNRTIGVLCGKGNNGGDGWVVARLLKQKKASVVAVLSGDPGDLAGDPLRQYQRGRASKVPVIPLVGPEGLKAAQTALEECDLLVDALFGTGISRPIEGLNRDLILLAKKLGKDVVAVDIPSGLSADSGCPMGEALSARMTVTFGLSKLGFYTPIG